MRISFKRTFFGQVVPGLLAAGAVFYGAAKAAPITSFDGTEVSLAVNVTSDGRACEPGDCYQSAPYGPLTVSLLGSNTATIGDGHEFTLYLTGSGIYGPSSGYLNIDLLDDGTIEASAQSGFALGSARMTDFSFDLSFAFSDPAIEVLTASTAGGLGRGSTSVSGSNPIVWTFMNENDNAFGQVMTFNAKGAGPIPSVIFTADQNVLPPSEVPLPAAAPLMAAGLGAFGFAGMRRKRKEDALSPRQ
ncbi:hypothetical protein [Hyphococcus luteus]|uniref:PEP-CTERM protein-sorting domain-containing protein n=1 Tax=Hyphococcus luteus TaxID=2058213 RepID=A0A2S7K5M7_9PROT|nr:hypothetical protein [Marinicaulis flavus]PQA87789.1 hypothetical protein CW354_05370 [Marinicaulis flavus]